MSARRSLTLLFLLAACGGRVDDQAAGPLPAVSGDGCTRACERLQCAATGDADDRDDQRCLVSCRRDLDEDAARRYAACLEALSCADIQRGLSMDYGPIGECWTKAQTAR